MTNQIFLNVRWFLLIALFSLSLQAQKHNLSEGAEISIITCGPGHEELYEAFGHSAIRIKDKASNLDRVYNYGTFNFNTPNFYIKFARGKLDYELRAYPFSLFLKSYQRENRWVKEQVLDLETQDKIDIYQYLETNAEPRNRAYKYDFFYNNCSTKIYDVLKSVLKDKLIFDKDFSKKNMSHRDLIQLYLKNHQWGDFGIDLALGSSIDDEANSKEYLFLPDFVLFAFNDIKIKHGNTAQPIVKTTLLLNKTSTSPINNTAFNSPLLLFSVLMVLVLYVTYRDYKNHKKSRWLDFTIFTLTGIVGLILLLLWFATDHTATVNNYNILWAFAPNLVVGFYSFRTHKWLQYYYLLLLILLDSLLIIWIFKLQVFSLSIIPILVILYARYGYGWYYHKKNN